MFNLNFAFFFALTVAAMTPIFAQKKLCSKIFFQNIDENSMPWVQVEGVYNTFSENKGFPVYSNNPSNMFFYYSEDTTRRVKILAFGQKVGEFFGLVGQLPEYFDPRTWLASGSLNPNDLFGDVVTTWMYYSPLDRTFKTVPGPAKIKAVCVDADFFRCDSGKVYLNDTITGSRSEVYNDPHMDYFAKLPSIYSFIRPVFKHNRQQWYLYYLDGYWRVGASYLDSSYDILRVRDSALRPEYVTNNFMYQNGSEWREVSGMRIKCRGIANGENKCYEGCNRRGRCVYTSGNETVCLCQDLRYGAQCEETRKCTDPEVPASSVTVAFTGKSPGEIATSFCVSGYRSSPVEFYVCENDSQKGGQSWILESAASCPVPSPPTIMPPSQRPASDVPGWEPTHINHDHVNSKPWDQSQDFMIFFIAFLACHVLCPAFIWLGIMLARIARSCHGSTVGSPERFQAVGKAAEGRYLLLIQTYSAFFNFAFWVWLCALCVCLTTAQGGTHSSLFYGAVGLCLFCAVFVIVEAFFSSERKALRNIITWDYIVRLHSVSPVVTMVIERYDLKLQKEPVYGTNPATGRTEYQTTEERWVKIGQKTVTEPFMYSAWTDESAREIFGVNGKIFRVKINLDIILEGTAVESFEAQKSALIEKTKHLNILYSFTRKDSVPGYCSYVVLCPSRNAVPCWMDELFFWTATLFQLCWPYRWFFNYQTSFLEYTLKKKICSSPDALTSQTGLQQAYNPNYPGQTSFVSPQYMPQAPVTSAYEDNDFPRKPLIDNQNTNENYMAI